MVVRLVVNSICERVCCVYYCEAYSGECFATSEEMMMMMVWVVQLWRCQHSSVKFVCQGGCQGALRDFLIVDLRKRKRLLLSGLDA